MSDMSSFLNATVMQMVADLPPGEVVDRTLLDGVRESSRITSAPLPNYLSPSATRELLDCGRSSSSPALGSVVVGLRDPESVRVVAGDADLSWMRWAVHLNPVASALDPSELPPLPDAPEYGNPDRSMHVSEVLTAALPNVPGLAPGFELHDRYMKSLNLLWGARHTWSHGFLPVDRALLEPHLPDWVFDEWENAALLDAGKVDEALGVVADTGELADGPVDAVSWDLILDILYALVRRNNPAHARAVQQALMLYVSRNQMGAFPPSILGGDGFMNAWLPGVLWSGESCWRLLFVMDWKPVAGRLVGERLYGVTGDDLGLWVTGLDLLSNWVDDLEHWLEAVAALK